MSRPVLYFQFERGKDGGGVDVDVRCTKHLPKKARVVGTEVERRRFVKSWLEAREYHRDSRCFVCAREAGAPVTVVQIDARKIDMAKWEEGGRKLDRALRSMGLRGLVRAKSPIGARRR